MAEKRKPTYDLEAFKQVFSAPDRLNVTGTALRSAFALGLDRAGVVEIIQTMRREQFVKSMTSYADHREWQDVYHVPSRLGALYVKFRADPVAEFLLLSFKERDDG
jgi:motility quorum-sensing regulator/GCU-specific mRNA interferase toxin